MKKNGFDIYEAVKENLLKNLEAIRTGEKSGKWIKPWSVTFAYNYTTGKAYRGVNQFLLSQQGSDFLTFNQIKKLQEKDKNIHLEKGSKSHMVIFWKMYSKKDEETGEEEVIPCLRFYNVFDVKDVNGIEAPTHNRACYDHTPEENQKALYNALMAYMKREGISYRESDGNSCFYCHDDSITVADSIYFKNYNQFLGTLSHEVVHSSGAAGRMGRDMKGHFGGEKYSKEELVAEFGSALLLAHFGLDNEICDDETAAYINGWMKTFEEMSGKVLVSAMAQAEKAVNYILDIKDEGTNNDED